MPYPTNKKQLRGFIGAIQFFRRFIPRLSSILAPITKMVSAKEAFDYTEECKLAQKEATQLLAKETLRYYPDFTKSFEIMKDASDYGIGAVVYQVVQGPNLKARAMQDLYNSYGIKHKFTTTYMATANSICERLHGTINKILRCVISL